MKFSTRLDCVFGVAICVFAFSFLFYFIEKHVSHGILFVSGSRALCTGSTTSLTKKIFTRMCLPVVSCTIHGTHKPLFLTKFLLKMGVMALFIHLKTSLTKWFREGRVQLYNVHCPLSTCHNSRKIKVATVNTRVTRFLSLSNKTKHE